MTDPTQPQTKTVLLVEDDTFLGDIVGAHLEKSGLSVVRATTGEEALHEVTERRPDLIILDIVLSGMSGLDVMARLQTDAHTTDIPFIVFTNSDEDTSVMRGKTLGAVKYLVKAMSTPEQIVREVKSYFEGANA